MNDEGYRGSAEVGELFAIARRPGTGTEPAQLVIEAWTTECGDCGYGRGGWAASPAFKGKPILTPDSRTCHGCGVSFTHSLNVYTAERVDLRAMAADDARSADAPNPEFPQ